MSRPTRLRWPLGLLGMLVLIVTVETTLARDRLRFIDTASLSWRLAVDAIPREASRCEVACLGDSLVKIGVLPEVVRDGSGQRTYNFAMAQAPAPASYFLLRRLLEAGGKPSAIVVDFKTSVLAGGPRFSLRHWQEILSPREFLELAMEAHSGGMLVEIGLGRLFPSYRNRMEIRESVRAAFGGKEGQTYTTNQLAWRNWQFNLGSHVNSSKNPYSGDLEPETVKKLFTERWKPHRINVVFINRLLKLAESRQIPVYWLIPPISPQLQARSEQLGVDAAFVAFVRSMQVKYPGVIVVDGRNAGYDASTFADYTHLNGRGSIAMSHDLGEILSRPRPRPRPAPAPAPAPAPDPRARWVALPRFRDWSPSVPLEDIDQSRIALEAEATRRR